MITIINLIVVDDNNKRTTVLVHVAANLLSDLQASEGLEKKHIKEIVKIKVNDVLIANGNFGDEVPAVVFSNDIADISILKESNNF